MTMLNAIDLHLWRGEQQVLRAVSLSVEAGQCLQVSGVNGAGKSTLLRALCGLLPLESGQVQWRGSDVLADRYAFHAELAWLGHGTGLKGDLTAHENLRYSAGLRRRLQPGDIEAALRAVGYASADTRLVRQMSAGQQRRVALARVLLLACPLWMLDEPTANLDRHGQELFGQLLHAHLERGGLAVVATHQDLGLSGRRRQELTLT